MRGEKNSMSRRFGTVYSIFMGRVKKKKNNWEEIARVFMQVKLNIIYNFPRNLVPVILVYKTYEDGIDRVFRNVGT